jgi:hypothetical protein
MKKSIIHSSLLICAILIGCVSSQKVRPTFPVEVALTEASFRKAILNPDSELPSTLEEKIKQELGHEQVSATIIVGFRLVALRAQRAEYDAYFKVAYQERQRFWPVWGDVRNRWVSLGIQRIIVSVQ